MGGGTVCPCEVFLPYTFFSFRTPFDPPTNKMKKNLKFTYGVLGIDNRYMVERVCGVHLGGHFWKIFKN